jgi:hypothetical protein
MMAVAAAAVAMTMATALTSGGDCGSRSIGEEKSYKGGKVLNLKSLGGGVGCGVVDKPTEEGTGEWEGGNHCRCPGFDGGGCGLLSPLSTSLSLMSIMTTTTTGSLGGGEMMNEWDFEEVARRRRVTEVGLTAQEEGGRGVANLQRCYLYCGWSLIAYTGITYKTTHA